MKYLIWIINSILLISFVFSQEYIIKNINISSNQFEILKNNFFDIVPEVIIKIYERDYSYIDPKDVIPKNALEKALNYYDYNHHSILNKNYLSIIDFTNIT